MNSGISGISNQITQYPIKKRTSITVIITGAITLEHFIYPISSKKAMLKYYLT